jgi:hypothetical protein
MEVRMLKLPFKVTESLSCEALIRERAERVSRELEKNMVDCIDGDICDGLYNELVSELPVFGSVPWDDIAESLQGRNSIEGDNLWSAWRGSPLWRISTKPCRTLQHGLQCCK